MLYHHEIEVWSVLSKLPEEARDADRWESRRSQCIDNCLCGWPWSQHNCSPAAPSLSYTSEEFQSGICRRQIKWLWEFWEGDTPKWTGCLDSSCLAWIGGSWHLHRAWARSGWWRTLRMKKEGMLDAMERVKLKKWTREGKWHDQKCHNRKITFIAAFWIGTGERE